MISHRSFYLKTALHSMYVYGLCLRLNVRISTPLILNPHQLQDGY